jgi:hypothetical protein
VRDESDAIVLAMSTAPPQPQPDLQRRLEHLEAERAAEEWWSFARRLVSMAAGTAGIGALIRPEGATVGAVVGVLLGILITGARHFARSD